MKQFPRVRPILNQYYSRVFCKLFAHQDVFPVKMVGTDLLIITWDREVQQEIERRRGIE